MKLKRVDIITTRLQAAFSPTYLEVNDESDQHVGHAGHQGGSRHFAVVIAAPCFEDMSRVEAHRKIYALFEDMMPHDIHALKISVIVS
ncbi:MAG: hypothetical protein A3F14_04745 [Gammaproteobacteria bacterium RIFCSPHIGHO2_12_FULL_43_28]|nr:MAG: hypothetical protein A3F14_04745 [Gammaproteobacteria bacterium RIFCSPHIGHO2_12_FULL_43_28]